MVNYHFQTLLVRYQKPGYYNDPDFLITDHPGLTDAEKRSHFALWASFGAPLIISAYIPDLSDEEVQFLSNKELIAVDQDPLAQQAALVSRDGTFDVLTRSLANGDRLLTVLNTGSSSAKTTIPLARLGLKGQCQYKARDLWTGKTSSIHDSINISLDSHATAVYRITPGRGCTSVTPTGMILNTVSGHCLTASSSGATFKTCNAADTQVWSVSGSGTKVTVSPLSNPSKCLAAKGSTVALVDCKGGAGTIWSHTITGHLQNANGDCLTESGGQGTLAGCELLQGGQILGLPSGVHVVDGSG
jgi:alpha-galactosidase